MPKEQLDFDRCKINSIIVRQHLEDAVVLQHIRANLTRAPHVKLKHICRFDDRISAHLDGLSVAGEYAWQVLDSAFVPPPPGALFAATVLAIERKSGKYLNRLYALAEAVPECHRGMLSAFGWVEQDHLRGIVNELLDSREDFLQYVGIAACAMHRVDPGSARIAALEESASVWRARSLRAAGELGSKDLLPTLIRLLESDDESTRFWASWSAVVLGNQGAALAVLESFGEAPGVFRSRAFRLSLQAMSQQEAGAWLRELARNTENLRWLIQGSGIAGDPTYVRWLIGHMAEKKTTRIAGEAFSLITGLDLAYLDLDQKPPEDTGAGPNDDPNDPNVAMDEDDGLPWPNAERISKWWESHGSRFTPGERYFMGAPVTRDNCLRVLKEGFQRQRILAAHYLCLLDPGTPLFEWRAPAYRQQRLLASMS